MLETRKNTGAVPDLVHQEGVPDQCRPTPARGAVDKVDPAGEVNRNELFQDRDSVGGVLTSVKVPWLQDVGSDGAGVGIRQDMVVAAYQHPVRPGRRTATGEAA